MARAVRWETESAFDSRLRKLPEEVQQIARHAIENPLEAQYAAKKRGPEGNIRRNSMRIKVLRNRYRAIAELKRADNGDEVWSWYFVGTHGEYDRFARG